MQASSGDTLGADLQNIVSHSGTKVKQITSRHALEPTEYEIRFRR
jgi:hypothetical protein